MRRFSDHPVARRVLANRLYRATTNAIFPNRAEEDRQRAISEAEKLEALVMSSWIKDADPELAGVLVEQLEARSESYEGWTS